jgi:hypothetical protein
MMTLKPGAGDTSWVHTAANFDDWLEQHASDIDVGPDLTMQIPTVCSLAELDGINPYVAAQVRGIFRRRWAAERWFPARTSVVRAAHRAGLPLIYVGPCPHCDTDPITATVTDGRLTCPNCGAHLAGRPVEGGA